MLRSTVFFFFNDPAPTEIYPLSLLNAIPISQPEAVLGAQRVGDVAEGRGALVRGHDQVRVVAVPPHHPLRRHHPLAVEVDRKSTRLNSSHANISYAVFCLKKNKTTVHVGSRL